KAFAQRFDGAAEHEIVGDLDDGGAGRLGAGIDHTWRDGGKQRPAAPDRFRRSAHHRARPTGRDYLPPAEPRWSEPYPPSLGVNLLELLDGADAVRAGADVDAALRQRVSEAARLADHLQHGGVVGHHRENRGPELRSRFNRADRLGAGVSERRELGWRTIVDADLVAGVSEAPRHHLAHAAKPDESDFHCVSPVPRNVESQDPLRSFLSG